MSDDDYSVVCGVLCHFALDSTLHPLINEMANYRPEMHETLEHALDVRELSRRGLSINEISHYFVPYLESQSLRKTLKEVYGWDDKFFKVSYRHMQFYYYVAIDKLGLINLLFHMVPGRLSSISYRNKKCYSQNLTIFNTLIEKAINKSVVMIEALFAYRNEEIDANGLLIIYGNLTYTGIQEVIQ